MANVKPYMGINRRKPLLNFMVPGHPKEGLSYLDDQFSLDGNRDILIQVSFHQLN